MKHLLHQVICMMATVLCVTASWAQDVIITTDAKKIEAKILEVSKSEIKYKEHDNLDGPTFILPADEISSVIYSNGKVVLYDHPQPIEQKTNANNAKVLLKSGMVLDVELLDMNSQQIVFMDNGVRKTLPASQISTVTLANGQVKSYAEIVQEVSEIKKETQPEQPAKQTGGRIYRDNGHYLYNNTYISSKEVERLLQQENGSAYKQWQKADKLSISGAVFSGIGCGLMLGSIYPFVLGTRGPISGQMASNIMAGSGLVVSGGVCAIVGIGLLAGASSHYNKAIDLYNSKYDKVTVQFKWRLDPNAINLAIVF